MVLRLAAMVLCLAQIVQAAPQTFRVATYNVQSYLDEPVAHRKAKSAEAKAKVCENIVAIKPDVIALEEMGTTNALMELQASLKNRGVDLPFWEHVLAHDPAIHLAILSRFPTVATHSHTNDAFMLGGHLRQVGRGFAEVKIAVNDNYQFTLLSAHLKSRVVSKVADEAEVRLQEAMLLRKIIDARLAANPELNLIVCGDFNDVRDSDTIKTVIGNGANPLFDLRPAERPHPVHMPSDEHAVTWTHHFPQADDYSRIDYIFVSRGIAHEWLNEDTYVFSAPDWGVASDHRPLVADFVAEER